MARNPDQQIPFTAEILERWMHDVAQRHVDDVVLEVALFKPNAPGGWNLSRSGFGQRQKLKARGVYLAERVVVAVTDLDVYAIELLLGGRIHRTIYRWQRTELVVQAVATIGGGHDPRWPALLIARRGGRMLAEVQPLYHDTASDGVCRLLLTDSGRLRDLVR